MKRFFKNGLKTNQDAFQKDGRPSNRKLAPASSLESWNPDWTSLASWPR